MKNHFTLKTKGVGYVKQKNQLFVISASNRKTKNKKKKQYTLTKTPKSLMMFLLQIAKT